MKTKFLILISLAFALHAHAGSATWNLNPTSGDWNTAANWTPATVPNGPADTATFAASNISAVSLTKDSTEVAAIVFDPGASTFDITADPASAQGNPTLSISGPGIVNNSEVAQNLTVAPSASGHIGIIEFMNAASAGEGTVLTVSGSAISGAVSGGLLDFHDNSTAGAATVVAIGALAGNEAHGGEITFDGHATAGNASITVNGAQAKDGLGAQVDFFNFSSASDAVFIMNPAMKNKLGGTVNFWDSATAANSIFTLNGSTTSGEAPIVYFQEGATAANGFFTVNGGSGGPSGSDVVFFGFDFTGKIVTAGAATFINNGGKGANSLGGHTAFYDASTASQARLVANGGEDGGGGGGIRFIYGGDGGEAQIEVHGNGNLDVSIRDLPGVTIGSLAGDGFVYLASRNLTVGSNNLNITFSGIIQEAGGSGGGTGGSLTKIGTGTLTLSGASTYTGGTMVAEGILRVRNTVGSATGTAAVMVNGGTLGGSGIIAGPVTVGTGSGPGASLQPSIGASKPTVLAIQKAITFKADGTYRYKLNTKKGKGDQLVANGVTIESGAQFNFNAVANSKLANGTVFTPISNTSATAITGTFANLPDGAILTASPNKFQASYEGGDGNDLTLTVVQ